MADASSSRIACAGGGIDARSSWLVTANVPAAVVGIRDASGRASDPTAARELYDAMIEIARTGRGPAVQKPSVGCSIKWRER